MEVTHLFVVYLLVGLSTLFVHAEVTGGATEATITEDQQKVYDECRNPDYKKYVKCLMRPKRHGHHTSHGDGPETDPALCLETCLKKCDHHLDHDCEKKCNYCTKRTRHRHQIITEYETECVSGNCSPANDGLKTTNITTNIGINNIIKPFEDRNGTLLFTFFNRTGPCCPFGPCQNGIPPCSIQPGYIPPGFVPPGFVPPGFVPPGFVPPGFVPPGYVPPGYVPPGYVPPGYGPVSVPSLPVVPQISFVPQITYGIGFGAAGGCAYNQWLCIQQTVQGVQPDCSGCGNPVLRYKCDVNCYAVYTNTATKPPCKSPECVGGST